jgi:hypothetical protein
LIAREKQRKQLGGGAIADRETIANNASVDGPLAVNCQNGANFRPVANKLYNFTFCLKCRCELHQCKNGVTTYLFSQSSNVNLRIYQARFQHGIYRIRLSAAMPVALK